MDCLFLFLGNAKTMNIFVICTAKTYSVEKSHWAPVPSRTKEEKHCNIAQKYENS